MAQYINKSALVAEIERRRDAALMRQRNLEAIGQVTVLDEMVANQLNRILSFINTLEVKEVDLKNEFYDFLDTLIGKDNGHLSEDELFRIAEYFYELGLKARTDRSEL